jgi:hypothetical protein
MIIIVATKDIVGRTVRGRKASVLKLQYPQITPDSQNHARLCGLETLMTVL